MNDKSQAAIEPLWRAALEHHAAGRLNEAVALYDRIIEADGNLGPVHANRAAARLALDQPLAALADLDRALVLQPGNAASHSNRAVALRCLGRLDQALAGFETALSLDPRFIDAHANRGEVLNALGRHQEALQALDQMLGLAPEHPQALTSRALALGALARPREAEQSALRALHRAPRHAPAHFALGVALQAQGRRREAVDRYDNTLALNPGFDEARLQRGICAFELGRLADALADFEAVVAARPDSDQAHYNRGRALSELGREAEAILAYDRAIALRPDYFEAHNNRGAALTALRRPQEASVAYQRSMDLAPDFAAAFANQAMTALTLGDFGSGWPMAEWRKRTPERLGVRDDLAGPQWLGEEDIRGETLLVHAEQGLGDTLQFYRYLQPLVERGADVVFASQPALVPLLSGQTPGVVVIGDKDQPPAYDRHCALLSLPLALGGADPASLTQSFPYLRPDPQRVALWRSRLGGAGFRIGVAWRSSRVGASIGKSFPLAALANLAALKGVRLISLQKGEGSEEAEAAVAGGMAIETLGEEFDAGPGAFLNSAAVMASLDLVITADTAVAHLAGALDCPVWVALKHAADWRWLLDRTDTPWYPSMRLFRQERRGEWDGVFAAMERALEKEMMG